MYDKELIERVCNLTCSKEDVCRNQTTIVYDPEFPFKKYYNVDTIIGAINKYLSKEWDDKMLASWCCIYDWILCGGFRDDLQEDLNFFEDFLKEVITWDLDGLSFFDEEYYSESEMDSPLEWIEQYKNWDRILQTQNEWRAVYAMVGPFAEFNDDQYVVIINDTRKEYMIIYSDFLDNGIEADSFKYTTEEELNNLVDELKTTYKVLHCSEEFYYSERNHLDD